LKTNQRKMYLVPMAGEGSDSDESKGDSDDEED
jgi:hypothetical protein